MTQLDDLDFIAVRIQHERREPNSQLQCLAGLCNSSNQRLFSRWFDGKSEVTSSIFNCRYSVFFWHLLVLEQMMKEVPGIRPAVISIEAGTRLDEYHWFRRVVRNVYTDRFDPAKLGNLVNSSPELFARTKAELLAFAAFSKTSV